MIKNATFCAFLIVFTAFPVYAEIVTGRETVPMNHDFSFSPSNMTENTNQRNEYYGNVYPCSTSASIDLSIATEFALYTCAYPCYNIAIGSPRPFYMSRKSIFDIKDFAMPLDTHDTSRFVRCDTIRKDMHIPAKPQGDDTHCYQPHIGTTVSNHSPLTDGFLLLVTSSHKNVIAVLNPIYSKYQPDGTFSITYISDFDVIWYLQKDGSLNFSDITGIRTHMPFDRTALEKKPEKNGIVQGIFNIRGQRIASSSHGIHKPAGVMILKKNNGISRVFISDQDH